ncbi:YggS family pyridoxal phosphate-dependent enzyme [Sphingobium sp. AN558]|uniref:YggS family pyridoxal phosphate-dependent enzyme n=1 Tax=Sphingobium sp. AN558 TaxID=3133442 RepID=UPI0030BD5C16
MTDDSIHAAQRLTSVRAAIDRVARLTDRNGDAINLIAISKTQDAAAIRPLIAAGQRVFGENRVQEAQDKWPALREAHADIALHHVGQLQSNKATEAVALFDVIHGLDRPSLLTALARAMDAAGRRIPCYIQVNIGAEPQKGGCAIADTPALIAVARSADIPLLGLMCVPPADVEPAPYFALLAKMAREQGLPRLSMGMSGDFETAIMLGATDVRIGTALFGERQAPARPVPGSGRGMIRNAPAR